MGWNAAALLFSVVWFSGAAAHKVLPRPDEPFAGKIGLTYRDSTGVKPELKIPQNFGIKDATNVLLVLIDDFGFGQMGSFGGGIPTPALDRVANDGLRYTRIQTAAICSTTPAALLTGRIHHSGGSGVIGDAIPCSASTSRVQGFRIRLSG